MTQIRPVTLEDAEPLVDLLRANREFLAPWAHVILDEDRIIGRVTLSNVVRGAFQSGNLGYGAARGPPTPASRSEITATALAARDYGYSKSCGASSIGVP